jgi:hypothetical protein
MDPEWKKEIRKFIKTATLKQLEETRVEVFAMRGSITDPDLRLDVDVILKEIAEEQWARKEADADS